LPGFIHFLQDRPAHRIEAILRFRPAPSLFPPNFAPPVIDELVRHIRVSRAGVLTWWWGNRDIHATIQFVAASADAVGPALPLAQAEAELAELNGLVTPIVKEGIGHDACHRALSGACSIRLNSHGVG